MPGNRAIYDRAMEQSREAARLKRWDDALKSAARALQEFPKDGDARTSVAVALFHAGKLAQSLQLLQELHQADAENPYYLEYIARAHERQGNTETALNTYQTLAEIHQNRRAVARTIEVLREILRLRPDLDEYRERLAHFLAETRVSNEAAAEYLNLARRYQGQNRLEEAVERAEEAVRQDPNNREAKELIVALRDSMAGAAGVAQPDSQPAGGDVPHRPAMTGNLRSQTLALEKLVAEAVEKQEAGDIDGAAQAYEQVIEQGLKRADIFYSLGLIYQERGDYEAAVKVLKQALDDPEYALSVHYALGGAYTAMKQLPQAAQEFEQAISLVDVETVGRSEAEDLIQMYEQVTDIYKQLGDLARAAALYSNLANFLKGKRWGRERATDFTKRAKELTEQSMLSKLRSLGTGALVPQEPAQTPEPPPPDEQVPDRWGKIPSIMDSLQRDHIDVSTTGMLSMPADVPPPSDPLEVLESLPVSDTLVVKPVTPLDTTGLDEQITRWIVASERYIEQGFLDSALDACYEVMFLKLDYMPIHLRIGEIYERQHLVEEALNKYQTLIDTFIVRNEKDKAVDVYMRFVNLSPDTINARARLADLLNQLGRVDEAAEQLLQVAASYFRLGQTNRALEEYRRGLQWAPKHKELRAQYGLALFKLERFEAAMGEFQKVADPDDPIAIAHINMTLAMLAEQPAPIWDSLAALLEKIGTGNTPESNAVQSEYRSALLMIDDPLLHYILGVIQQHSGQHSSALLEFEQAQELLEAEPNHPILPNVLVHQAMSTSYIELEQSDHAQQQITLAQQMSKKVRKGQIDPNVKHPFAKVLSEGEMVWQMAEAFAAADDLENAEKALREALRLLPYNQAIYTKLADVCFRQGKLDEALRSLADLATYHENRQDLDKAIEILNNALKLAPGNITIGERLARLYIRRGYPDKGVEGLLRVAELQRKEGQIKDAVTSLQQAAEIRWMQGKQEETLSIYDRIVQVAPQDVEARQWRAIMYTLVSRTAEAIAEKKEIVNILAQRQDYDNAIAELHQIIGLNTNDLDAYYMLGDMLMRRGEYTQALNLYHRMNRMTDVETERVEALIAAAQRMIQNQQMSS